jgi:spore coat protein CotH
MSPGRIACALLCLTWSLRGAPIGDKNFTADELFQMTHIWKVELTFTPDQWKHLPAHRVSAGSGQTLLGAPGLRNGLTGAAGMTFDWVHAELKIDGIPFHDIAVRYKGNGTYRRGISSGKVSLKLDLNKYVKGQKLAKLGKINLASEIADGSYMNEDISYRLFREAGVPAPRTSYARVYITIAGEKRQYYRGLYSLTEDVDEAYIDHWFHSHDGALFKPVMYEPFTYMGEDWKNYIQAYAPRFDVTEAQKHRLIEFTKLVNIAADGEFNAKIGDYVDLDEFARFLAVSVWAMDYDSILFNGQNYYVYQNATTNKYVFLPWDQDETFAKVGFGGTRAPDLDILQPYRRGGNKFLARMLAAPAFRSLYLKYIAEYNGNLLRPDRLAAMVDELAPIIRPAVKDESAEGLAMFDAAAAGESFVMPPWGAIRPLKPFAEMRSKIVAEQLKKAQ